MAIPAETMVHLAITHDRQQLTALAMLAETMVHRAISRDCQRFTDMAKLRGTRRGIPDPLPQPESDSVLERGRLKPVSADNPAVGLPSTTRLSCRLLRAE